MATSSSKSASGFNTASSRNAAPRNTGSTASAASGVSAASSLPGASPSSPPLAQQLISSPGLFRLILAYVVVIGHFTPIHFGSAAVYLFFMLSGFWIFEMWGKEYAFTAKPYLNFIVSRAWRLAPIYYLSVATWLVLYFGLRIGPAGSAIDAPTTFGWPAVHFYFSQLFLLGLASLPLTSKVIPAAWSIDVELQFYLIAPLVVALVSSLRFGAVARLVLYGIGLAGLAAFIAFYNGPGHWLPSSAFLPMFLLFFLIGVETARSTWMPSGGTVYAGVLAAAALTIGCLALPGARELVFCRKIHSTVADYNSVFCIAIALLLAPYAMATVRKVPAATSWLRGLDRDFGNISYEVYLLHGVGELVIDYYYGSLPRHARLPIITLAGAALLPISWLVYRFIDRPIDKLRTAWVKSRPVAASPDVQGVTARSPRVRRVSL
jgi:peptidoglycan/LPS O-acetylase OafA/YrhL